MTRPADASPASDPILRDLAPLIEGEVRTDPITRSLFATVASPKTPEDVARVVAYARAQGLSVTARGGGSSLAGQAVGEGIILDFSTYMNRVLEVDLERRLVRVEPGAIHTRVQRAAAPHGLRLGPGPSS